MKRRYIMDEPQFEKILDYYFEMEFTNSFYDKNGENNWEGFYILDNGEKKLIFGTKNNIESPWFAYGNYFNPKLFDLSLSEFNERLRNFVNKKYKLNIEKVF